MKTLLVLPIVIPLLTAVVLLLVRLRLLAQRCVGTCGAVLLLAAGAALLWTVRRDGIQVLQLGAWPAPFGITFVADLFSAAMVVVAGGIGLAVAVYAMSDIDPERQFFSFYPLLNLLLMGVCGAFLTGDIFNLYVWFEVMLTASFVLLALGGERAQIEGSIKYFTINLLASAIFLAGVGLLYAATGTLNMADLAVKLRDLSSAPTASAVAMLFLVAFGIKAAVFPLFFWLPASYHTPPAAVSAVFAGLLTKVGVYALVRVFTLLFLADVAFTHTLLLVISAATMVTGVLGAMSQQEFRRILSFHIVSQIGYMTLGLALFTPLAVAGSVFYIIHHIVVKTNLFLVSGVAERICGSGQLARLGGLYQGFPLLAVLFLVPAMSLAGIPPLSGFFAKLALVRAGLEAEQYAVVAVALVVGLLTLYSMVKIWTEAFWKPKADVEQGAMVNEAAATLSGKAALYLPMLLLAGVTVSIGFAAGPLMGFSILAAEQLLDPSQYVEAVLGNGQ